MSNPPLPTPVPGIYANSPSVNDISPSTPTPPDSQLAKDEAKKEEVESRRSRLSSNLLEQKHTLIKDVGGLILSVIIGLYLIFGVTMLSLLLSGRFFAEALPVTAVVLIAMTGSIPTILSISLLVGLFAKDKDHSKDEKSVELDTGTIAKVCFEVLKYIKH